MTAGHSGTQTGQNAKGTRPGSGTDRRDMGGDIDLRSIPTVSRLVARDSQSDERHFRKKDLFGDIPESPRSASRAARRTLAEKNQAAAFAEIPKVIHVLGQARDAAAPYERSFWAMHRELEDACAQKPELTKDQLFGFYDRRMEAGHAWYPFRQAVQSAEDWLAALQKEIKECDAVLGI